MVSVIEPATPETKRALSNALQILEVFRSIDPDMPMGEAVSFLMIALGEQPDGGGLSITELKDHGGFVLSSASRYSFRRWVK